MKKIIFVVLFFVASVARAAGIALVYESSSAVKADQAILGAVTPEGIVVSAKWALANNATMLTGIPGDDLKKASLLRLDAKSDAALIQLGEVVNDTALQDSYRKKAQAFLSFLPSSSSTSTSTPAMPIYVSTAPYKILLNGKEVGQEPIPLKVRFRKSELNLEFVRTSTVPVWYFDFEMTSTPKMSFWKKGKNQSLSDVPDPVFRYSQQIFFHPLTDGRSVKVDVVAYYMDEGPYTLNLVIKSKGESFEVKVPVIFKSKL